MLLKGLLEHTFVEVRRRTKIIGRFLGETSALGLPGGARTRQPRLAQHHDAGQGRGKRADHRG